MGGPREAAVSSAASGGPRGLSLATSRGPGADTAATQREAGAPPPPQQQQQQPQQPQGRGSIRCLRKLGGGSSRSARVAPAAMVAAFNDENDGGGGGGDRPRRRSAVRRRSGGGSDDGGKGWPRAFTSRPSAFPFRMPAFSLQLSSSSSSHNRGPAPPSPAPACMAFGRSAAGPEEDDGEEEGEMSVSISPPLRISHDLHVWYNVERARFEGLEAMPSEWREHCNRQFGVPFRDVPKMQVPGYPHGKVPAVLVMLRAELASRGGLATEGIFRLTPDRAALAAAKDRINRGAFEPSSSSSSSSSGAGEEAEAEADSGVDVHVLATLVKAWLRECPNPLLAAVDAGCMARVAGMTDLAAVAAVTAADNAGFPLNAHHPQRALFDWLLDLMATVVANEAATKMTPKSLAIVMAPNLHHHPLAPSTPTTTPTQRRAIATAVSGSGGRQQQQRQRQLSALEALQRTEVLCEFVHKLLLARLHSRGHLPTADSQALASPIAISASALLAFRAVDSGGGSSNSPRIG